VTMGDSQNEALAMSLCGALPIRDQA